MPRKMRTSHALVIGKKRLTGLKSFAVQPKIGPVSEKVIAEAIDRLQGTVDAYNHTVAEGNMLRIQIKVLEREVRDLSARVLTGVATVFGKDSPEYEKVGGTKTSERKARGERAKEKAARKRPHKRAATETPASTPSPQAAAPMGGDSSSTTLA